MENPTRVRVQILGAGDYRVVGEGEGFLELAPFPLQLVLGALCLLRLSQVWGLRCWV